MRRLAVVFLLSAAGTISTASNDTLEQQGGLGTLRNTADWNTDGTGAPMINPTGRIRLLDDLFQVFNPQSLASRWNYPQDNLTQGCGDNVNRYLTHLHKGEVWALKSE
jgi:hypothetical protein